MKNLIKRIKLLLHIASRDMETLRQIDWELSKKHDIHIIKRDTPYVTIIRDEYTNELTAYPFNLTQEEFDDIMSREWEDE